MAMSSGDLAADRRFEWARDCRARGDPAAAIDLLRQVLELVPDYATAWFALADLLDKQGNREQAIAAYRKARAADPQDRHGALPCLIRLGAAETAELPSAYIRSLFDQYAPAFDTALVEGLDYRAPALRFEAVRDVFCIRARSGLRHGARRRKVPPDGRPPVWSRSVCRHDCAGPQEGDL